MVYIKTKFPRGILDQVISSDNAPNMDRAHDGERERSPGPGLKLQASSFKLQASEKKSGKRQAPSTKLQAPSQKIQAP